MAKITTTNEDVVSRVRDEATRAGVTQGELAARIGLTEDRLKALLDGSAVLRVAHLDRIADALGIELTALIPQGVTR